MEKEKILNFLGNSLNLKVVECACVEELENTLAIQFEDTSILYIASTWRLERADEVLAVETDLMKPVTMERMSRNLKLIEGKCLRLIDISDYYDLTLVFDEGYCLKIFCIISYYGTEDGQDYSVNWLYDCIPLNRGVEINNQFTVIWEDYASQE